MILLTCGYVINVSPISHLWEAPILKYMNFPACCDVVVCVSRPRYNCRTWVLHSDLPNIFKIRARPIHNLLQHRPTHNIIQCISIWKQNQCNITTVNNSPSNTWHNQTVDLIVFSSHILVRKNIWIKEIRNSICWVFTIRFQLRLISGVRNCVALRVSTSHFEKVDQ